MTNEMSKIAVKQTVFTLIDYNSANNIYSNFRLLSKINLMQKRRV